MSYFVEDLVESIKTRSLAPIAQTTFDDAKLIEMANEELQLKLVSDLVTVREDFFLTNESASLIASVENYAIPSRSIGNTMKQLFYVDSSGTIKMPIPRVDSERAQFYSQTGNQPEKHYILGDEVILLPTPSISSGTLQFVFPARPNELVATSSCAKITAKSSTASTASFTVNTDLTATLAVGSYVDFLSVSGPFKLWAYHAAITQITATQIDVAVADVNNVAGTVEPLVNDYICPSGQANIPQIPIAFHPVLAQMVVVRLMESLGDINKLNAAKGTLAEMRNESLKLVKNRVANSPLKVTGRNQLGKYFR